MNDKNYNVFIYKQDDDNPKNRTFKGKYTNNIRFDSYNKDIIETDKENKVFSLILEKIYIKKKQGAKKVEEYKGSFAFCELNTGNLYFSEIKDSNYICLIEQILIQNNPKDLMIWTNKEFSSKQIADLNDILSCQKNINYRMNEYKTRINHERMLEIIEKSCCNSKIPSDIKYYPR